MEVMTGRKLNLSRTVTMSKEDNIAAIEKINGMEFNLQQLRTREYCNVSLTAVSGSGSNDLQESEPLYAHRVILESASPYFEKLFQCGEPNQTNFNIPGVKRSALEFILDCIYNCEVGTFTPENMCHIYTGAKILELYSIRTACENFMEISRTIQNCLELWTFGRREECDRLCDSSFIIQNLEEVSKTDYFSRLTNDEVNELMSPVTLSGPIFLILHKWVTSGNENQTDNRISTFLSIIRKLPREELDYNIFAKIFIEDIRLNNNEEIQKYQEKYLCDFQAKNLEDFGETSNSPTGDKVVFTNGHERTPVTNELVSDECPFDYIPNEILHKILNYLPKPENSCVLRLVSKRFKEVMETGRVLKAWLNDDLLEKIGRSLPLRSHPFKSFQVDLTRFTIKTTQTLVTLLETSTGKIGNIFTLSLDIQEEVEDGSIINFLLLTNHLSSLKIDLKMAGKTLFTTDKSIHLMTNDRHEKFPQLTSLNFHDNLLEGRQVIILLNLIKKCPNLTNLSIGNENWDEATESAGNLLDFLTSIQTSKQFLQLSLLSICPGWIMSQELVGRFQRENITIRKIQLQSITDRASLRLINSFHQNLQVIYNLLLREGENLNTVSFNELTVLGILCGLNWLESLLRHTPALKKMAFYNNAAQIPPNFQLSGVSLPHFTTLALLIRRSCDVDLVKIFAPSCPNLKKLMFYMSAMEPLALASALEPYPQLDQLQVAQNDGVSILNLVGLNQVRDLGDAGESLNLDQNENPRRLSISHLKKLRILSFAIFNYYTGTTELKWRTDLSALKHCLMELDDLEEIHFPPLTQKVALEILTPLLLVEHGRKKLKLVQFQVWTGPDCTGAGGTMTTEDVEKLNLSLFVESRGDNFKIKSVEVKPADGSNNCQWFE